MTSLRRVLVTGANKGIGKAIVAAILEHDTDTAVLLGSRNTERGEAAREELIQDHPDWAERLEVLTLDVADDASVSQAASKVIGRYSDRAGVLYGIVNNAGIGRGEDDLSRVLQVNTYGPRRVVQAFLRLLSPQGRIVNISSASGPMFLSRCSDDVTATLTSPDVRWIDIEAILQEALSIAKGDGDFSDSGLEDDAYGLSKAALSAYTLHLARKHPELQVNACTPGFIETDLTRHYAESQGVAPEELGMKPPSTATRAPLHLLFGELEGNGWYYGSDAVRSPLDRYRSPGDPPYTGD